MDKKQITLSALLIGYLVSGMLFFVLFDSLKENTPVIMTLPLIASAWILGLRKGLALAVVFCFGITPLLFLIAMLPSYSSYKEIVISAGAHSFKNIPGLLATLLVTGVVGRMRDLNQKVKMLNQELLRMSKTDYLTQLPNRRAVFDQLHCEIKRARRLQRDVEHYIDPRKAVSEELARVKTDRTIDDFLGVFSCAIIDIDFFKMINDTYGHLTGDEVLRKISSLLLSPRIFRETDIAGRIGGEEFLIIFPGTSSRNAAFPLRKFKNQLNETEFKSDTGKVFNVTVSGGISELRAEDDTIDFLIHRADEALYRAKKTGRNKLVIHEDMI
ncbi:MAG: diguanylate cyclase [Chitinivibrionales bacterium]|nr:diguanylate cyclase [Chitinivibrionales bacterium]MBD3358372.1 diguanylate cyclase [Chitinivibrionales bacterium]